MEIQIIIDQITKMILLVLVGVFAKRLKILPQEGTAVLGKLLIYVTLPILTFFSITSYRLPEGILQDSLFIIIMAFVIQLGSLFFGDRIGKFLKLKEVKKNVFSAQLMIGNTVFLAFPLMLALFGEQGLIYAIIYYLISLTCIWTIGVYLFNKHQLKEVKQILKALVNPCTIAFVLGMIALFMRIDIAMERWSSFKAGYQFLYDTFYPLGNTTMSLSMVFIGCIIGEMNLREIIQIFREKSILVLVGVKMFLVPFLMLALLSMFKGKMSDVVIAVVFIESLMPASTITVAIAKENGSDYIYAMEIAIATTIMALISLPVMMYLFEVLNKLI